jgi:hypothetical protein
MQHFDMGSNKENFTNFFFNLPNSFKRRALWFNQPLTEMSTRIYCPKSRARQELKAYNCSAICEPIV